MINKIKNLLAICYKQSLFLLLALAVGCGPHPSVKELTELESQYLESFFRHLFKTTTAGYVLYGERPLFFCTFKSIENTIPGTAEHKDAVLFTQGRNAWKKLKIQDKNYLLFLANNEAELYQEIIFINKKAFKDIVKKNLSLFQLKLGPQVNEQNLLNSILSPNRFSTLFKGHEALQGILFGYGVENSVTYERGNALCKKVVAVSKASLPFKEDHKPNTPEELENQLTNYIDGQKDLEQNLLDELADFTFYIPEKEKEVIPKIPFSFHTKSEESKKLLESYQEAEKKIINLQNQKKFLEKVLKRLKQ